MADRRSQSDESLIVEYFTVQPLAACDALLNQIADILRKRRPKKVESGNNAKPATEPTERKPSQRRKAERDATVTTDNDNPGTCNYRGCNLGPDENVHHMQSHPHYHTFEPAGEASKGVGV